MNAMLDAIHNKTLLKTIVVYGEPASKANSRRWTGKFFIKSKKALEYSKTFAEQVPLVDESNLVDGDIAVSMNIFYRSRRPDLDESLILDLLQGRVYRNDRQVKVKYIVWGLDKDNPRTEITIWLLKKPDAESTCENTQEGGERSTPKPQKNTTKKPETNKSPALRRGTRKT